ncbi:uncharacterized protein LOC135699481 [Ochlerotatus camptorhynchus]|uniref:uncharacterized protein LOC135699481 n=1 Tax=Ochlerotatus camptorhynchus TaxID=644619 RepID=UPI0031E31DAE
MIIMRALVGTVLLISVVLVSIVLINANSRHERSSETIPAQNDDSRAEVDKSEMEVLFEGSLEDNERMGLNPEQERKSFEMEETLTESVKSTNGSSLLNAIVKAGKVTASGKLQTSSTSRDVSMKEENRVEEDDVEEQVVIIHENSGIDPVEMYEDILNTANEIRSPTTQPLTTESEYYNDDAPAQENSEQQGNDDPKETYLESKTINNIKTRSKESQWAVRKSSPTTERQTPLGYEPESYIVLDEEPNVPVKTRLDEELSEVDDLDPTSSISSRPLERKQRAVVGSPETIVLNRAPIVPHIGTYQEPGCPHMFPPSSASRYAKSMERSRPSYPGMASIYEPNHWDNQNMNVLRSTHCTACQRKQVPLCVTCGRCSECCGQSGCTCGCLSSQ